MTGWFYGCHFFHVDPYYYVPEYLMIMRVMRHLLIIMHTQRSSCIGKLQVEKCVSLFHDMNRLHGENDLPIYHRMLLITTLAAAVLENHSPRTDTKISTWNYLGWHELVHGKTLRLFIILTDDAFMSMCIWPFTWHNKYKLLQFINTSLAISHLFVH